MTAGQRRYAEMIAIRLAVEILAGQSRCQPFGDAHLRAAKHLGATATNDRLAARICSAAASRHPTSGSWNNGSSDMRTSPSWEWVNRDVRESDTAPVTVKQRWVVPWRNREAARIRARVIYGRAASARVTVGVGR